MKQRVGLYARVSTEIQVEGFSLDEQISRMEKYAAANDWLVVDKFIDGGYSGSNLNRPEMQRLITTVKGGALDAVPVYKPDRLSRSQRNTLWLIEAVFIPNNVSFVSITENFDTASPFGRATIGLLSVFAQLERENIKSRMMMGRTGRVKSGYRTGGKPPFGYDYENGKLVVNDYEAMQVREMFRLFNSGKSIRWIASYMKRKYVNGTTACGATSNVQKMLRNKTYIGIVEASGIEYKGIHEPIIDKDTWDTTTSRYKAVSKAYNEFYRRSDRSKTLLSGLLWCGSCGHRYVSYSHTLKWLNRTTGENMERRYRYYRCYWKARAKCPKSALVAMVKLDNAVLTEIKKLAVNPDAFKTDSCNLDRVKPLEKRLKAIGGQIDRLMDLYSLGAIDAGDITAKIKSLNIEREKMNNRICEIEAESERYEMSRADAVEIAKGFAKNVDEMSFDDKRKIIVSLIDKIEINPDDEIKIYRKFA